MDMYVKYA